LESVFDVADRVDVQTLASVAGPTLLEQEKYLLTVQKRLSDELWRRLSARIRMSEGIRELVAGLQIGSIEDFRHVSLKDVGTFDMDRIQASTAELDVWKSYQQDKDSDDALDKVLGSLLDLNDVSGASMQRDELLFNVLLKEKSNRIAELEEKLGAIRAIARKAQLSQDDIVSVIHTFRDAEGSLDGEVDAHGEDVFDELCDWILQRGGQLDVSKRGLDILAKVQRGFEEVQAGRLNALEFLHRTLEEASMLAHDASAAVGDGVEGETSTQHHTFAVPVCRIPLDLQAVEDFMETLAAGKEMLHDLSQPVETSLRSLFYSMNEDFAAFGIDTEEERASFFLGCKDEGQEMRRAILDKYAVRSSSASGDEQEPRPPAGGYSNDSFLSRLDPAFPGFHLIYSVSFGDLQLQRLRNSIADMEEVKRTVKSAQNRLRSLQKIMKIFNKINEFKAKIAEFEASASQKDRLFGNSLRLLEEERFRKMAAKHYPNLLASLRKEVTRWLDNEDGEYDLSVLGEDLKNLLLDMMSTNTGLMHLDLGTVRRASAKAPLTPNASSSNLQAPASGNSTPRSATPARVRTQSLNSRASTPRARHLD
jgi:hypothetical protein